MALDKNKIKKIQTPVEILLAIVGVFFIFVGQANAYYNHAAITVLSFLGFLFLFMAGVMLGKRYKKKLNFLRLDYLTSLKHEKECRPPIKRILGYTLLANNDVYILWILPTLLLPLGGFYAWAAYSFPILVPTCIQLYRINEMWKDLEVKPNFFVWMHVGIYLFFVIIAYAIFFLVWGGEVR